MRKYTLNWNSCVEALTLCFKYVAETLLPDPILILTVETAVYSQLQQEIHLGGSFDGGF